MSETIKQHPLSSVATTAVDLVGQYFSSLISGSVSQKFNKRSEERADQRNRKMLLDQPSLTADGRRRAGLNPYGDATLPGMSGQSSIDTAAGAQFGKTNEVLFGNWLATEQLKNDTLVAESQANLNDAQAERFRGQEHRDVEGWQHQLSLLIGSVENQALKNSMLKLDLELKEYIIPNEKALSDSEVKHAQNLLSEQIANIMLTNATTEEKNANIKVLQQQAVYLSAQSELAKAGVELTQAQVEQTWATIANTDAQTLLTYAKTDVEREAILEIKARVDKINAETKEIPANARRARWDSRFSNIFQGIGTGLSVYGAIATGGMSAAASSVITDMRGVTPPSGLFDQFGNKIEK